MRVGAIDLSDDEGDAKDSFLEVAGSTLKVVNEMKVLGCMVSCDAHHSSELEDKIARATSAFFLSREQL
eukprot:4182973-Karenia_brevis.AAC.1